jgi:hypothetical protein
MEETTEEVASEVGDMRIGRMTDLDPNVKTELILYLEVNFKL